MCYVNSNLSTCVIQNSLQHHCRSCGQIFCDPCSDNKLALPSAAKPVRVCDACFPLLLEKHGNATNSTAAAVGGGESAS